MENGATKLKSMQPEIRHNINTYVRFRYRSRI